jgi:hypothetical protein
MVVGLAVGTTEGVADRVNVGIALGVAKTETTIANKNVR